MASQYELTAEPRHELRRGASRRLRGQDKVPAIMYGGGEPPRTLSFSHKELIKALENEAFYSRILTIHLGSEKLQAVLKDLQRHPFKERVMHMDLLHITGKEKITMTIPLHFKGGDVAPGVKKDGGLVSHIISSIDVRCLPKDLPEFIEVDLSNLALDESIHLSQLAVGSGVEIIDLAHGNDQAVVNIHIPRAASAEEELTAAPVSAEVPATAQKAPEAAAAPAAGDKGGKPAAGGDKGGKDKAKK